MRSAINTLIFVVITFVGAIMAILSRLFDRSGNTVLWLARIWSRLILSLSGVKLTVRTEAPLDPARPYVFMPNHLSTADIWSLFVAVPFPVRMIAKKQLGQIPLFGWAMWAGRFIFIDRESPVSARRSIDEAARRIEAGHSVLIFPEGTRSRSGALGPFKKGGFHLAIAAHAEIVPVGIRGSREVMPRGSARIYPGEIVVQLGAPMSTVGLTDGDRGPLLERVHAEVVRLTGADAAGVSKSPGAASAPAAAR
jgi:1-acyl-sn-glycerol-3-phosphate acyltransferase